MTKRIPKLKFTQDKRGLWRWSLIAANGRTLADSGEGYASNAKAERGFLAALEAAHGFKVVKPVSVDPKTPKAASGQRHQSSKR
jgi:uncharacterized protein YegP (UPF0339 family)